MENEEIIVVIDGKEGLGMSTLSVSLNKYLGEITQ